MFIYNMITVATCGTLLTQCAHLNRSAQVARSVLSLGRDNSTESNSVDKSTSAGELSLPLVIGIFAFVIVLLLFGVVLLYCCYKSPENSTANSKDANVEEAISKQEVGEEDYLEQEPSHRLEGGSSRKDLSKAVQPSNEHGGRKKEAKKKKKARKGRTKRGQSIVKRRNSIGTRRNNKPVAVHKNRGKKAEKPTREAGKGASLTKQKKGQAKATGETMLYNEGLQFYKHFLKSVHSVKSVSQYFADK